MKCTLYVKPKNALPDEITHTISYEEYVEKYSADVTPVVEDVKKNGLNVVTWDSVLRTVDIEGTKEQLEKYLHTQIVEGFLYRYHTAIKLPHNVESVHGLWTKPVAKPHFRWKKDKLVGDVQYTPKQIAQAYTFPTNLDGSGVKVAIIELGGNYYFTDNQHFASKNGDSPYNVTVKGSQTPNDTDPDGEVSLDYQIIGGIAPKAQLTIYFGPNTDAGFLAAINQAIHDKVDIISISWGGPESAWTPSVMQQYNNAFKSAALLGIVVLAAAGDNNYTDGAGDNKPHVDFPSSSPYVICCGGTRLEGNSETVWNNGPDEGTGGGVSAIFKKLSFQNIHHSMRGCPDVTGNADPNTGYYNITNGQEGVIGGTSAVAPLYAGLLALCKQAKGTLGFVLPKLYAHPEAFKDITVGNNGWYKAHAGWDEASGLGSPNGQKILEIL